MGLNTEKSIVSELVYNKINPDLGVEITNLTDITKITDYQVFELKKIIKEHFLVLIKGSRVWTEKEHIDFTRRLGDVELPPIYSIPLVRLKEEKKKKRFVKESGIQWHSDNSDKENPSYLSVFQMPEIPPQGSETHFVSLIKCCKELPEELYEKAINYKTKYSSNAIHPIFWKHPFNGEPTMYFDFAFVSNILDMSNNDRELTVKESNLLMDTLNDKLSNHNSKYLHDWELGDIIVVDNYAVAHKANFTLVNGESRILLRTTTEGIYF